MSWNYQYVEFENETYEHLVNLTHRLKQRVEQNKFLHTPPKRKTNPLSNVLSQLGIDCLWSPLFPAGGLSQERSSKGLFLKMKISKLIREYHANKVYIRQLLKQVRKARKKNERIYKILNGYYEEKKDL